MKYSYIWSCNVSMRSILIEICIFIKSYWLSIWICLDCQFLLLNPFHILVSLINHSLCQRPLHKQTSYSVIIASEAYELPRSLLTHLFCINPGIQMAEKMNYGWKKWPPRLGLAPYSLLERQGGGSAKVLWALWWHWWWHKVAKRL